MVVQFSAWSAVGLVGLGALIALGGIFIGVWLVSKFQFVATGGATAFNSVEVGPSGPESYVDDPISDMYGNDEEMPSMMDIMTSNVDRLRSQHKKAGADAVMNVMTGGKGE